MTELKENLKKALAEAFNEMVDKPTSEDLSKTVARLTKEIETQIKAEPVSTDFIDAIAGLNHAVNQLASLISQIVEIGNANAAVMQVCDLLKQNAVIELRVLNKLEHGGLR